MFSNFLVRLRRLRELGVVGVARRLSARGRRFIFYHRFKRKALAGRAASSWDAVAARHRFPSDFACFWQDLKTFETFERLIDHPRMVAFRPPAFDDPAVLRSRADQIVGNVFEVFGSVPVASESVPWLFDFTLPRSLWGTEYWNRPPLQFFMDLAARQPAAAGPAARAPDIKVPWELSRFHHLVVLGFAYRRSGAAAYASAFESHVASWFAANPFLLGVNWVCPMDVALRLVNLIWAATLFKDAPTLSTDFWRSVVCSIHDHLFYLSHTWETSDKPNNHYLADLVGYLYGAAFFKKIEYFDKNFEKTLAEFEKQVRHQCGGHPVAQGAVLRQAQDERGGVRQQCGGGVTLRDGARHLLPAFAQAAVALAKAACRFSGRGRENGGGGSNQPGFPEGESEGRASRGVSDGTSYEGSTAYHRLDTEMVLHVICLCESLGRAVPPALLPIFEKMITFLQDCSDQGGFLIKVGDDDSGKVVTGLAVQPALRDGCRSIGEDEFAASAGGHHEWGGRGDSPDESINADFVIPATEPGSIFSKTMIELTPAARPECQPLVGVSKQALHGLPRRSHEGRMLGAPSNNENRALCELFGKKRKEEDGFRLGGRNDKATAAVGMTNVDDGGSGKVVTYPSFGLTILKKAGWHMTYRHPTFARHQPSGHFHHDELAFTLSIGGHLIFGDPGSYRYTASRYWRDAFRGAVAHNTFFIEKFEQHSSDLFQLDRRPHDIPVRIHSTAPQGGFAQDERIRTATSGVAEVVNGECKIPLVLSEVEGYERNAVTTITDFHRRYADQGITCWRSVVFDAGVQELTVMDWLAGETPFAVTLRQAQGERGGRGDSPDESINADFVIPAAEPGSIFSKTMIEWTSAARPECQPLVGVSKSLPWTRFRDAAAVTWSFHGAPGITFRQAADGSWVIAHEQAGELATVTSTLPLTIQADFYAPAYGVLVSTYTLTATVAVATGQQVTMVRGLQK